MKLYPHAGRIFRDLENLGFFENDLITIKVLNKFDQLHYHGIESVQYCIDTLNICNQDRVLEIGSGWGGPSRYIAHNSNAIVTALELQEDYHEVGARLTQRCGLQKNVKHRRADFLTYKPEVQKFDKIVSWLALYHIPNRPVYTEKIFSLMKPGGKLFIEDLTILNPGAKMNWNSVNKNLFANSLIGQLEYRNLLTEVGFEVEVFEDMPKDWSTFTSQRYQEFLMGEKSFTVLHGQDLFNQMKHFYGKIVKYFKVKAIGGLRIICTKPD